MTGMVFTPILACFLNIMVIYAYFSLIIWILYYQNTLKTIPFFILLSNERVPISRAIFAG